MWIGQVMDLSDPTLLVLDLFLWENALHLGCFPRLCSVGSWHHPIHLEILLNVKHITRKFNSSKELSKVIIHLNDRLGIVWAGNIPMILIAPEWSTSNRPESVLQVLKPGKRMIFRNLTVKNYTHDILLWTLLSTTSYSGVNAFLVCNLWEINLPQESNAYQFVPQKGRISLHNIQNFTRSCKEIESKRQEKCGRTPLFQPTSWTSSNFFFWARQ